MPDDECIQCAIDNDHVIKWVIAMRFPEEAQKDGLL